MNPEITRLRGQFREAGDLSLEMVRLASSSYFAGDTTSALQVLDLEKQLNKKEVELEQNCQTVLTIHPMDATSIRWILSILRASMNLERVGDHCFKLAKRAQERGKPLNHPQASILLNLSRVASGMWVDVLQAFYETNVVAAQTILTTDESANRLKKEIISAIQASSQAGKTSPSDYEVFVTASDFERIADHACNIAEEVIVLTSGIVDRRQVRREREKL